MDTTFVTQSLNNQLLANTFNKICTEEKFIFSTFKEYKFSI
jgi:hypothetical protein